MDRLESLQRRGLLIPMAIVVAAVVLGIAIYFTFSESDAERCIRSGGNWVDIGTGKDEPFCHH